MTHAELIQASLVKAIKMDTNAPRQGTGWARRHCFSWEAPNHIEAPIVNMIKSAAEYADKHQERFESKIGDDGVLGDHWEAIIKATRGLLNGECGRIDCGTADGLLCAMLTEEGFDPNV